MEWDRPFGGSCTAFFGSPMGVSPAVEYSGCSLAPGWNVKYRARGRALCTIYPDTGTFTCMISIGQKEAPAMELALPGLTAYVREVSQNSRPSEGRWLMIRVSGPGDPGGVKTLLRIRMPVPGRRETKAENIRLAGKGRERCAGGKEEKEGQSSVFFLHPDEIRHELPGHRVSGADSAEHLPGAGLPGPAVWLQAGFAEEPGCGDGLCPDGAGAAHLGPGGAGHDHAGQQRA